MSATVVQVTTAISAVLGDDDGDQQIAPVAVAAVMAGRTDQFDGDARRPRPS